MLNILKVYELLRVLKVLVNYNDGAEAVWFIFIYYCGTSRKLRMFPRRRFKRGSIGGVGIGLGLF